MRHAFRYALAILLLCVPLYALSLWWRATWISPDHGTRLSVAYGCLDFWHGSPGDWSTLQSDFRGPYSIRPTRWTPRLPAMREIKVMWPAPGPPGTAFYNLTNYTLNFRLPLWIPTLLALFLLMFSGPSWFRHARSAWRRARQRCVRCGYDLSGILGRCPECGMALLQSLRRLLHPRGTPSHRPFAAPHPTRAA